MSWPMLLFLLIVTAVLGVIVGDRWAQTSGWNAADEADYEGAQFKDGGEAGSGTAWRPKASSRDASYLAFNSPDTMYLGRRTQVTAILHANYQAALDALREEFEDDVEGRERIGRVKAAKRMLAVLRGKNFRIEAIWPGELPVVRGRPTTWAWYVEPIELGRDKRLRLELFAILSRDRERFVTVPLTRFDSWIDVKVAAEDRFTHKMQAWGPVSTVAGGLAGVLAIITGLWAGIKKVVFRQRKD